MQLLAAAAGTTNLLRSLHYSRKSSSSSSTIASPRVARVVENIGVGAYLGLGAAHHVQDPRRVLTAAASIVIATVESRHNTILNIFEAAIL